MVFTQRFRGAISAVGLGIKSSAREQDSDTPTITSGAGVPTGKAPAGSLCIRTDASDSTASIYQMQRGSWVGIAGSGSPG